MVIPVTAKVAYRHYTTCFLDTDVEKIFPRVRLSVCSIHDPNMLHMFHTGTKTHSSDTERLIQKDQNLTSCVMWSMLKYGAVTKRDISRVELEQKG